MKTKLLLLAFAFTGTLLFSQGQNTAFEYFKTTDGTQNFFYKSVTKTDGLGNVYVAGATLNSAGNTDILVAKYNSAGVQLWIRQYAGSGNGADFAGGLYVTNTDVYLTGAVTTGTNLTTDVITMRYSSAGVLQWATTYNGTGNSFDSGKFIVTDGSNNVYITGSSYNASGNFDFVTIKYSSTGAQQWVSLYDYSAGLDDAGINIATMTSNVVVTGAVTSATNNYKVATLTYAQSTGSLTAINVGTATTTSSITAVTDLGKDVSGNIYIVGSTYVSGQNQNYYVQKLSNTLATIWTYTYNSASNLDDIAKGVGIDASSNVYLTGYSTSSTQGRDITTVKLNSSGVQQWVQTINGTTNGDDEGADMVIDATNNIYITGYTNSSTINKADYYTVKYNTAGTKIWDIQTDGNHLNDNATNMALDSLNNIIITGQSETAPNVYQFLTTKYVQMDVITPTDFNAELPSANFKYYENKGQLVTTSLTAVPDVRFYSYNTYPSHYIKDNSSMLVFSSVHTLASINDTLHRIDMTYDLSSTSAKTYPAEVQKNGYLNYFLPQTGSAGITGVLGNQRLITSNIYPNIDLMYSSNQNGIKYYYIVKPGGNPKSIGITFTGASSFSLNGSTNALSINSSIGSLTYDRPTAYQLSATNSTIAVTGWTPDWQTNGASNKYRFNTGVYTTSLTLIIEVDQGNGITASVSSTQNLKWSTYFGGTNLDAVKEVKSDVNNNLFISGESSSNPLPLGSNINVFQSSKSGGKDAFVAKFKPNGELEWSTYMGGTFDDVFKSFDFSSTGDIYLVGNTTSSNLQVKSKAGAFNNSTFIGPYDATYGWKTDCFIFQLAQNGLTNPWLTYYTGDNDDDFSKCKFDANGNFFVVGNTSSPSANVVASGLQYSHAWTNTGTTLAQAILDAYIVRFDQNSNRTWATCFGSSLGSGSSFSNDAFVDLDFDSNGDVYAVGNSSGNNYPNLVNGSSTNYALNGTSSNGVISRFSNTGTLKWSTYLGGLASTINAVKSKNNNLYILGTNGASTPLLQVQNSGTYYYKGINSGGNDAFFATYNSNNQKTHCTFIGGSGNEQASDIEIDNSNLIYLSGFTNSSNFPTPIAGNPVNTYNGTQSGNNDYFVCAVLENKTDLLWSTLVGGNNNEPTDYKSAEMTIDGNGFLHLGGSSGSNTTPYPTDNGGGGTVYFQPTLKGINDGTVSRFDILPVQLVGIKEVTTTNSIGLFVFPNPTSNNITIKLDDELRNTTYSVTNAMGQVVLVGKITTAYTTLTTNSLTTGMYIITVTNNNNTSSIKFIKHD